MIAKLINFFIFVSFLRVIFIIVTFRVGGLPLYRSRLYQRLVELLSIHLQIYSPGVVAAQVGGAEALYQRGAIAECHRAVLVCTVAIVVRCKCAIEQLVHDGGAIGCRECHAGIVQAHVGRISANGRNGAVAEHHCAVGLGTGER